MRQPKVVYVTFGVPYPCNSGGKLRTWANLMALRDQVDLTVLLFIPAEEPGTRGDLEHIGHQVGKVETIHLPPVDKSYRAKLWRRLNSMMPRGMMHRYLPHLPAFRQVLKKLQPDCVVLEFPFFGPFMDTARSLKASVIVDEPNIHTFSAAEGVLAAPRLVDRVRYFLDLPGLYGLERAAFQRADRVWVTSEADAGRARRLCARAHTVVIPNVVDVDRRPVTPSATVSPHSLIFTGSFGYLPNVRAAQILIQDVFPRIQAAQPDAVLLLVGRDPTEEMLEAARSKPGIVVTGFVPDPAEYLERSAVAVIPIYHGGGTRLKALEAWAMCRPVVSTRKGIEGLRCEPGVHFLPGESTDELVASIRRIWADPELAQSLGQAGRRLAEDCYSYPALRRAIHAGLAAPG